MKPAQRRAAKLPDAAFWRLLADYEALSSDETAALREEDFGAVAIVQALKAKIFAVLEESGHQPGIDRRGTTLIERLEKIADGERANHAFITRLIAANAAERKVLNTARARLRALHQSYISVEPNAGASFRATS